MIWCIVSAMETAHQCLHAITRKPTHVSWCICFMHLKLRSLGMVFTGDTVVLIVLLNIFHHILTKNLAADIWISLKAGTSSKMISLNDIASNLGTTTCKAMALFHAFTGSDNTSAFKFKRKRSCFSTIDEVSGFMEEFASIVETPYQMPRSLKKGATYLVSKLYSNGVGDDIDLVRLLSNKRRRENSLDFHTGSRSKFQNTALGQNHSICLYL